MKHFWGSNRLRLTRRFILFQIGIIASLIGQQSFFSVARSAPRKSNSMMNNATQTNLFDVIIVGGGSAGLSAALVLGRSKKRVLVFDVGKPRNAVSPAAHSFFSRDGIAPAELLHIGREQLRPYDSVEIINAKVVNAAKKDNTFQITLDNGTQYISQKLLLATGVKDILPKIEGFKELWGKSVFHCPYCHGWEVRNQPLAIYGNGESAFEFALLLTGWSHDLILCTDGEANLSQEQRQQLKQLKIELHEKKITRLESKGDILTGIVFNDGTVIPRRGIFIRTEISQTSDLSTQLGCKLPLFGSVEVNETKQASVPGVYVAGDAARSPLSQIVIAAADGATAAFFINHALTIEKLAISNV